MTNEQFSAQLRQHLLETANERPAQGQLASIVDRVAVTSQHPTLVARLPWFQGRVASSQMSALRWGLVALALIGATIAVALLAAGSRPRSAGFEGTWTAIDPADGSNQYLVLAAGATPAVHYVDELAASSDFCQDDPYIADGGGAVEGNRLQVTWPEPRFCGSGVASMQDDAFTYDEATDTFVDDATRTWVHPMTWTRAGIAAVVPTPAPERTPRLRASAPWSIGFDAPGTYTAPAGSLSLTVSVPATAEERWIGRDNQFGLNQDACTDFRGGGWIEASEVTHVETEACQAASVAVRSPEEAIAAVSTAKGIKVVAHADVAIDGHAGTRLDIKMEDVPNVCEDGLIPLVNGVYPFNPGVGYPLYLVDVEGKTLALAIYRSDSRNVDVNAQLDDILASMQIEP